jgi:release factor glutamine methyltransferase
VIETPISLVQKAAGVLAERGIEHARLDAELLLAAVLGVRRLDLYLQFERPMTAGELDAFRSAVRRRMRREPLQYVVGSAAFRTLELSVDRRVLIPRPETELLAGLVLDWSKRCGREPAELAVLDIGTGSGAIALSLAAEGGFGRIVATDVSAEALEVARGNAARNGLAGRVEFRAGESWAALESGERFDAIVSNPPYVAEPERPTLAPEVAEWEPAGALFAGSDGLDVVRVLVDGAAARLRAGGLLALEVGTTQTEVVAGMIRAAGAFGEPRVGMDLTGRPRMVSAVLMEGVDG